MKVQFNFLKKAQQQDTNASWEQQAQNEKLYC